MRPFKITPTRIRPERPQQNLELVQGGMARSRDLVGTRWIPLLLREDCRENPKP